MVAKTSPKIVFALLVAAQTLVPHAAAEEADLDALFERLQQPELRNWQEVEQQIWRDWSQSGSPTLDLLLQRGREAMEAGDDRAAMEHFSALVDHAPDFAEGYNARATVYFRAGRYGPAIADIRRTLALNPRHFGALTGLARILEEIGYDREALSAYRAAHALNPHREATGAAIERLQDALDGETL